MRKLQVGAGVAFVSAWVIGLVLAAGGPKPTDSAAKIASYFDTHQATSMLAHFLIDGVAGLAIVAIAYSLWRYLRGESTLRRVVLWAGMGAGVASLGQMVVGETMSYRAGHGASPDSVKTLFTVLNNGDTVKIAFLGAMIAAASILARRSGQFPRSLATGGRVFAPLLAISGLAFPLNSDALYASLALTLLLLLSWVVAVTVVIARRAPRTAATTTPVVAPATSQ
jgi:hypothetical protein